MARIRIRNKGELIGGIKEVKEDDLNNAIGNLGNLPNNSGEEFNLKQGKNIIPIKLNNEIQNRNSVNKKSKEGKNIERKHGQMDEE